MRVRSDFTSLSTDIIMETRGFGLVLLLVLCAALLAEAQPEGVAPRYIKFLNQHVYGDMAEALCNREMRAREITETDSNKCKDKNTFILATKKQVKAVCEKGGTHYKGDIYQSNQPFTVVTCNLQSGETVPHCDYGKGKSSRRYIRIGCDRGWPVHYDEGIIG